MGQSRQERKNFPRKIIGQSESNSCFNQLRQLSTSRIPTCLGLRIIDGVFYASRIRHLWRSRTGGSSAIPTFHRSLLGVSPVRVAASSRKWPTCKAFRSRSRLSSFVVPRGRDSARLYASRSSTPSGGVSIYSSCSRSLRERGAFNEKTLRRRTADSNRTAGQSVFSAQLSRKINY